MNTIFSLSLSASILLMFIYPVFHIMVNRCRSFKFNRFLILSGLQYSSALRLPCHMNHFRIQCHLMRWYRHTTFNPRYRQHLTLLYPLPGHHTLRFLLGYLAFIGLVFLFWLPVRSFHIPTCGVSYQNLKSSR